MPPPDLNDVELVESRPTRLRLSHSDAAILRAIGRDLASRRGFWGDTSRDGDRDQSEVRDRSVIRCTQVSEDLYDVTVAEAIGVISLPSMQMRVGPKVPIAHFEHLLRRAGAFPRMHDTEALLDGSRHLWELVAAWFIGALEEALRRGLLSEYSEHRDDLHHVRGTIQVLDTARRYYAGNLAVACEFDDLGLDSALNRVLKAAAAIVSAATILSLPLRRRARRALMRLDGIGALQVSDVVATLDRRTAEHRDVFLLARHVLSNTGTSIDRGDQRGTAFLIRTPDLVETAIRTILDDGGLGSAVSKRGRQIIGSRLTLNPDLVFGYPPIAIGDVKYKLVGSDWKRPDLYQLVSFAAGYGVSRAAMFAFSVDTSVRPLTLDVGGIRLVPILWPVSESISPGEAELMVLDATRSWLSSGSATGGGRWSTATSR